MRWRDTDRSSNIEDRRGQQMASAGVPSALLLRFLPFLLRTKLGRVVLLIGGIYIAFQYFTGGLSLDPNTQSHLSQAQSSSTTAVQDENAQFVAAILGTTETVWGQLLKGQYREPKLVLYRNMTSTGCGMGQAQSGPFYCPADSKVYIDLSFLDELKTLGAPGDFAFAYVIAHEVGHHVQNQLGISGKVDQMRGRVSKAEYNALSVRLELQADCFAGVWAHHAQNARQILEQGDVEEAMNAAAKIGDDALQRSSGGAVVPESFTHGTSAQRQRWFHNGLQNGSVKACDTFAARSL